MGYTELSLNLPTDFSTDLLRQRIAKKLRLRDFQCTIIRQSLDARRKSDIHWQVRVAVTSPALKGNPPAPPPALDIPRRKNRGTVIVVGSGPAGYFAARILQQAGFQTRILERGAEVEERSRGIHRFEQTGQFNPRCSYAFGEGGAGTFSDGKLTARSKHISREKAYIIDRFIEAGAPPEIAYLAHPHLGSDNLIRIVKELRTQYQEAGGEIHFNTQVTDLTRHGTRISRVITERGTFDTDHILFAPGHSAYETFRMLMRHGVAFRTKNFAIGCRVEHPQELINRAQWNRPELPGVKAAEYRLTCNHPDHLPVYTFCMCPGGIVVPATAYSDANIVNGMSRYQRNGHFANAACVAGINLDQLLQRQIDPAEALDWLQPLEHRFYETAPDQRAPACSIQQFLEETSPAPPAQTSHPIGLTAAPLWNMLPEPVTRALQNGLRTFARHLRGFEQGTILGLESKTSAPIQALREDTGRCPGFDNLYLAGEGSGYAGGIISSAADGIRIAMHLAS
jgi:hypothetical protein